MKPMSERLSQPTPEEVKRVRRSAGLNQAQAALLVGLPQARPERTWQNYETAVGKAEHRAIPLAAWELFLLMTGQHPSHKLVPMSSDA